MSDKQQDSVQFNAKAQDLFDVGRIAEAEDMYRRAIAADPSWSVPHYNLGLLCKYAGRWSESLAFNKRASELDPQDEAAAWNLGIAATALGDWATARLAWSRCGIELPVGDGPILINYGIVPIRLDPQGRAEVVWARRIDPARARIANIPFPETGYRFGDLVLHDGAAVGERRLGDKIVPVFNMLTLLETSEYKTFVLWAPNASQAAIESLAALAEEEGCFVEDWSSSVRYICATCSKGPALPEHIHQEPQSTKGVQPALAARNLEEALRLAQRWTERENLGPASARLVVE
ncbi:MAG: tetratricopeptide repeat protein [Candidatus Manganitrophus sp. SA1]|nr:tetratricopeptide repeat protein [Candidatus Manganitrophus morganii]